MVIFRAVEIPKYVKRHDRLSDSYSWKHELDEYYKKDDDSSDINLKSVIPVHAFHNAIFRESMQHLSEQMAFEVEVKDSTTRDFLESNVKITWIAMLKKVAGYRLHMRWLGCDEAGDDKHDFWINFCSADLHRVGWTNENQEHNGVALCAPELLSSRHSDWNEYIASNLNNRRTVMSDFESARRRVTKCKLQVGERVELLDNQVSTRVRPATVLKTVGRRVCLSVTKKDYDAGKDPEADNIGEERQYDSEFWVDQSSFYIFHVGWASLNGYNSCAKESYLKHASEIAEALSENRDPSYLGMDARPETIREWDENKDDDAEKFEAGMKLEFLDPLDTNFNKLKVGTVVRTMKDGYMIVAADGDDMENETVPFHATSSFLFPIGYATKYGIKLVPPGGDEDAEFDWDTYLKQTRAKPAPECLFSEIPEDLTKKFVVGSALEASDLNESHLICPAHVVNVRGRMLEIGYDGWGSEYNQLFDYRSNDIFPLGWCEAHGYRLEEPKEEEEPVKKKKK